MTRIVDYKAKVLITEKYQKLNEINLLFNFFDILIC
jgi:hypothetical protein